MMSENQQNATDVLVSIMMPCRNGASYVEQCINSVLKSDYRLNKLEVLVGDGQGSDETSQIVERIADKESNLYLIINEKQTTQHALDLGVDHAKGDARAILGAHSSIKSTRVSSLKEADSLGCIGGELNNIYLDKLSQAMSFPFGVGNAHFRTGAQTGSVDTVAFGVYKKQVFDKVVKFDFNMVRIRMTSLITT